MKIKIPESCEYICVGDVIKLGRFDSDMWRVEFGWFNFDDNRSMYGCYLKNIRSNRTKPLFENDLLDVYMISH